MSIHNINGNKYEILEKLDEVGQPGSHAHEQMKMGIIVRCIEDLEKALNNLEISMNNNAKSSNSLSKKVLYLNIILTIATVVASIIAVMTFVFK